MPAVHLHVRATSLLIATGALVAVAGGAIASAATSQRQPTSSVWPASSTLPTVHHYMSANPEVALGPQSDPTTLITTGTLASGNYLVQAAVPVVLGPAPGSSGSQEDVVCVTSTVAGNNLRTNYGFAGNGAPSGTPPAGVYGNAVMLGTVHIGSGGDVITLVCNSSGTQGTYAGQASMTVERVGTVTFTQR